MTNEELDRAVAVGPMGWDQHSHMADCWQKGIAQPLPKHYWHPTTDARDTERVMERMAEGTGSWHISHESHTFTELDTNVVVCRYWPKTPNHTHYVGEDPDWKRAVCLAAVEATK